MRLYHEWEYEIENILMNETLIVLINDIMKWKTFSLMRPSKTESNSSLMRLFSIMRILKYLNPPQVP